jgi:CHAT domain-containing protein
MVTSRGLCVILTLWMVSSRPSVSILPGASVSGAWWGTPESKTIAKRADNARRAGDLAGAEIYYRQGYDDAVRRRDQRAMVGYLNGIAAVRLTQLRYGAALETLLEAKKHATSIGDQAALGAIAVNLSNVYLQVRDLDSALKELEDGRAAVGFLRKPYFLPNLLIQLGRTHDILHDSSAVLLYRQGIEAARESGNKPVEALGLDLLGEERLGQGDLEEARKAIVEGMRLRAKFSPAELDLSWWRMGDLEGLEGNWAEAARYTDLALKAKGTAPQYRLKHQRGLIRIATGDRPGGLADLREAVRLSSHWRLEVLPASSSLTAANEMLDGFVFSSFIEAAAQEALRTGNQRWAEEAFEAVELNRAASLRESRVLADAWHRKVPPEYWEKSAKLREEEIHAPGKRGPNGELRRLRLELAEMEAKAGLGFPAKNSEIFCDQTSLIHFQHGLGRSEVLLSFHLGDGGSYLWTVTRETLRLYRIAAKTEIGNQVEKFEDAVQAGRPEAVELGERLYKELFGQLGQDAMTKTSWLLSLEGALFDASFAALVIDQKGGKVNYLVSKHSVQTIPGALLLSKRPDAGMGGFLGVGDPIYNAADPRWGEVKKPVSFLNMLQTISAATPGLGQYGRLVGSATELKTSAANWGSLSTVLLEGSTARRDVFLSRLAGSPSVIHLATHVVYPAGKQEGFIAFGLGPAGRSEFLTTTDVASLRVPGAFVAMTGCGTGTGDPRPGAGLIGLTRAWQMAGASAVLATSWRVRDSNGDVFASFYKYLRHLPAAEALRLSQMEMLQSGTWRAMPSYWAPYQITGGAR